jgi:phosphate-selective porin OprO and OprP
MPVRSIRSQPLALTVALTSLVALAPPAVRAVEDMPAAQPAADAAQPAAPDLDSRVRDLEETVRQLRETIHQLQETPREPPKATVDPAQVEKVVDERLKKSAHDVGTRPLAGWQDGFYLQSPDGDFRLRLRGYLQGDARFFSSEGGDTGPNSFFLRRVRPILEGTVFKNIDFRIMPDFGGGATVLQDAYVDLKFVPQAQLRVGKFKEPVSLERLQSGSELLFIERSVANNLPPNRDVGIQLSGDLAKGAVSYQLGAFNGVNDGGSSDGDTDDGKDIAARVFTQPFRNKTNSALQGLGFGIAGNWGKQKDALSGTAYRTAGRSTFFRYDQNVAGLGDRRRIVPQFYYFRGPFGLMGEYISSKQDVREAAVRGDLTNKAWFLQGSWVLTGEKASYRSVTPAKPFDREKKQWGAVELAARYARVSVDDDAFRLGFADPAVSASDAKAFTLGLNWYLNRNVKAQFNWERTDFDRSIRFGSDSRDHEDVFLTRLQLAF